MDLHHQLHSHTGRYRRWRKFGKHSKVLPPPRCQAQPQTRPPRSDPKSIVDHHQRPDRRSNPITAAGQTINYTIVVTNTGSKSRRASTSAMYCRGGTTLTGPPKALVATANWTFPKRGPTHQLHSHTSRHRCWRKFGKHSKCYHDAGCLVNHGHGHHTSDSIIDHLKTRQAVQTQSPQRVRPSIIPSLWPTRATKPRQASTSAMYCRRRSRYIVQVHRKH